MHDYDEDNDGKFPDEYYPCCFRDGSEIRPRTASSGAASATGRGVTGDRVIRFATAAVVCAVALSPRWSLTSTSPGWAGSTGRTARLLPLSVDSLILGASLARGA